MEYINSQRNRNNNRNSRQNQNKKLNPKAIGLVALLLFLFIFLFSGKKTKIVLKGPETVEIELGQTFNDEGAKATYGRKNISNKIQIQNNNFSNNKVGTYTITYKVDYKKKSATVTRKVNVVDKIAPELKLIGDEEINIAKGSKYQEFGCTAIDNYNGDITTKISIENNVDTTQVGNYTVTYTVKDSSGNTSKTTRAVNVVEKNSNNISNKKATGLPVLMYHFFYDKDAGETGKDNNYTEIHEFEKQLNYLVENKYYFPTWDEVLNYTEGKSCLPENSIVITVDDGDDTFFKYAVPVIEKYDVKVTSFVVTSQIDKSKMLNCSNKIIFESHSDDMHKAGKNGKGTFLTLDKEKAMQDLKNSQNIIGNSTVFCYPYGDYNDSCIQLLKDTGYKMAFTTNYSRVRPGDNPYALGRIRMSKGESLDAFIKKIS